MDKKIRDKISKTMKGRKPWNKGKTKKEDPRMSQPWLGKKRSNMKGNKFAKGNVPWNYIDGRSKIKCPDRYGDDWDKIRYLVLRRDNFTCQDCGIKKVQMDIHHKIPFLISFDNSLNNLITLCRSCHRKEEAKIMRKFKEKGL